MRRVLQSFVLEVFSTAHPKHKHKYTIVKIYISLIITERSGDVEVISIRILLEVFQFEVENEIHLQHKQLHKGRCHWTSLIVCGSVWLCDSSSMKTEKERTKRSCRIVLYQFLCKRLEELSQLSPVLYRSWSTKESAHCRDENQSSQIYSLPSMSLSCFLRPATKSRMLVLHSSASYSIRNRIINKPEKQRCIQKKSRSHIERKLLKDYSLQNKGCQILKAWQRETSKKRFKIILEKQY